MTPQDNGMRRFDSTSWRLSAPLVYLWAMVAPSAHLMLEPHRVCLEHGELVHRHDAAPPVADWHAATDSPTLDPDGRRPGDDEPHLHCHLVQDRPRDTLVPGTALPLAPVDPGMATTMAPPEPAASRSVLLALAPKHSPPCG